MSGGRLRFFPPTSGKKERDDELALFRELFKREREKNTNLLDAVSTELEPIDGNSVLYKISSTKKGDAPANESEKHDYDWLKTPPATPLFQSLEMDVGQMNPNMIVHKELPIISPLKTSRFSEKMETKTNSKPPSSPSLSSSLLSASSSRPETPDPYPLSPPKRLVTPITTPRFGGTPRFLKESNTEASVKPLQPGRFLRRKEEPRARPQSPGSASVGSSSSRPETPNTNLKPPSVRRAANPSRTKEDPKPAERSVKRFSKEVPVKQIPDKKLPSRKAVRPSSPSSRSVASTGSSRPETPVSEPIKSIDAPKSLDKAVKKTVKEAPPGKKKLESKPKGRTASPTNRSLFPATHPDFPTEAPPNLITSVAPGRATSATRSRPGSASAERRRTPSVTKDRGGHPMAEDAKGKEKIGGGKGGVVIGSSMVEKMMNARRSTGKVVAREDKAFKLRGK